MSHFSFLCRTKTSVGKNALEHLPFDLSAMGGAKPMVIQETLGQNAGITRPLVKAFKDSGMTLGISPPLPEEDGEEAARFIRYLYELYTKKGYDTLIALGGEKSANMAKALNIAVSLGPEALKQNRITGPLRSLVYLPTGVRTGGATSGRAQFNGQVFVSAALAPDQALVDPALFIADDRAVLLDSALTSLATGCEIFCRSHNPPARAYATTIIQLALAPLKALMAEGLDPEENLPRHRKQEHAWQKDLVHASVLTGYLASQNPIIPVIGQRLAAHTRISPGQAMAMVLPPVLESCPPRDVADLLLPLAGPEGFSMIPKIQQPSATVHAVQTLVNDLYRISGGHLPRTLEEAGWNEPALTALGREIKAEESQDMDPNLVDAVLTQAGSGFLTARP